MYRKPFVNSAFNNLTLKDRSTPYQSKDCRPCFPQVRKTKIRFFDNFDTLKTHEFLQNFNKFEIPFFGTVFEIFICKMTSLFLEKNTLKIRSG